MEPPRKLLDQVRDAIRPKHSSYRTEQTYVHWIRRFILFRNKQHLQDVAVPEIGVFLTDLAVQTTAPIRLCSPDFRCIVVNAGESLR